MNSSNSKTLLAVVFAFLLIAGCQHNSSPVNNGPTDKAQLLQDAEIGDFVWDDVNMNGMQSENEPGIAGIAVSLYNCDDSLLATSTTDANGYYLFSGLDAGDYIVGFALPDDYVFTAMDHGDNDSLDSDVDPETGMTMCITLGEDESNLTIDAGMYIIGAHGCTHGKGYWKNHTGLGPQDDLVTPLLPIWLGAEDGEKSLAVENAEMAYNILQQHTYGEPSNGITKLYAHLLTAKLNIANGANGDDIADLITEIDNFLADHDWEDWDGLTHDEKQSVNRWKGQVGGYNNGDTGPGACDENDIDFD